MKVLTVYAHHNPCSFCHAVLERFSEGLRDARRTNDVVDLHAIGFDPVFSDRDGPDGVGDSVPDDVLARWQANVAQADALAFVAPACFVGFLSLLKGWIERVFSLGFAFGMTADAWRGDLGGRIPLLRREKAVITQTAIWKAASDDDAGLKAAMKVLIDERALRYAGIRRVAHAYFHAVKGADDANRRACMDRARQSGRGF